MARNSNSSNDSARNTASVASRTSSSGATHSQDTSAYASQARSSAQSERGVSMVAGHLSKTSMQANASRSPNSMRSGRMSRITQGQDAIELLNEEMKEQAAETKAKKQNQPIHTRSARCIVENKAFVTLTTLLTLYALTADDIRLLTTNRPSDDYFDVITFICMVIFTVEIVLSCMGKEDYFMGFFFTLDTISTVTLIFDVTFVNEALFDTDEDNVDNMKNSKTARIGARAARIVRILRLVRILKLYKAIYDARQKEIRRRKEEEQQDELDWGDDEAKDFEDAHAGQIGESNLARKLSDLTTRRCVILILCMMLGIPNLQADDTHTYPLGQIYGANIVYKAFVNMNKHPSEENRWLYEEAFLHYVYNFNWFSGQSQDMNGNFECPGQSFSCPAMYLEHLFYLGITGSNRSAVLEEARKAQISQAQFDRWKAENNEMFGKTLYAYGTMPEDAEKIVTSQWGGLVECPKESGEARLGVSLLNLSPDFLGSYSNKFNVICPEDLRPVETQRYTAWLVTAADFQELKMVFFFDRRIISKRAALMNLITTFFICLILVVASMMFSHDARELVLQPVETMMLKVQMIRLNPLIAAKLTDEAFKQEQIKKAKEETAKKQLSKFRRNLKAIVRILMCSGPETKKVPNETAILEKTIMKLGTLLALGFGEAGMTIISHNMQGTDSASVDAMVPGRTIDCIIGSCRMGDFSTFTEVLQSRVMTFVNQVAEILHGVVDGYHGAPSRTSGDSFLAVWTLDHFDDVEVQKMGDMAVLAFALVLAAVHRSGTLATYRVHPGLQQRLGRKLKVTVTFGLHLGWAIEGALGSEYKIDATYVSPNVSIAETIERACEAYGTSLLLTEELYRALSTNTRRVARLIDRVVMRGCREPMSIYSVDLDSSTLQVEPPAEGLKWNTRQRYRARQFLEQEKIMRLEDDHYMTKVWETNPDVQAMLGPYTTAFREIFGMGYQNYSEGEWRTAQRLLSRTLTQLGFEDGPSAALMRFMQSFNNLEAPKGWNGVHSLYDLPPRHQHVRANTRIREVSSV